MDQDTSWPLPGPRPRRRPRLSGARAARLLRTAALVVAATAGTAALMATPPGPASAAATAAVGPGAEILVGVPVEILVDVPVDVPVDAPVPRALDPRRTAEAPRSVRSSRAAWRTVPRIVRDGRTVADWRFGRAGMLWPVPGEKTSGGAGWRVHPVYGYRSCHTGLDIQGTWGTPVLAAMPGVVTRVDVDRVYGRRTVVRHANGLTTVYAHQDRVLVRVGRTVVRGQVIGEVGSTGWATGPHLHFEVHRAGLPYDPLAWFLPSHRMAPVVCAHDVGF